MPAPLANIQAFTAPPQAGKSSQIPKVVGSAPCGSTHLHKTGTDLAACSILSIANLTLAKSAAGGFGGQKGPKALVLLVLPTE
jgi:hypothetical protein